MLGTNHVNSIAKLYTLRKRGAKRILKCPVFRENPCYRTLKNGSMNLKKGSKSLFREPNKVPHGMHNRTKKERTLLAPFFLRVYIHVIQAWLSADIIATPKREI